MGVPLVGAGLEYGAVPFPQKIFRNLSLEMVHFCAFHVCLRFRCYK